MATTDTKEHLIKVARKLFAQQGIGNITMNDIAQAANKSRRTLYTYFQSKEELLEASIEMEVMKISTAMTKVAMSTLPPDKKIIKLIFCNDNCINYAINTTPQSPALRKALL